ncbi:MAG: MarC family protein [Pseudoxanthomonas sp.]|nr:MarC family protein [Pseudoxanthomonas sp.]
MDILSAALLLFLIMDPLGNIPVFLGLLRPLPPRRRMLVLARELVIALVILFAVLLTGQWVLAALHLRQESISIGGGIVLFLIGLKMIFPPANGLFGEIPEGEPLVVPMAVPLIAGPSTMAALLLLANQDPGRTADWSLALLLAWVASAAILFSATSLYRWLGPRALGALERLMGMLLVALSVQMVLDGVTGYLRGVG